MDQSVTVRLGVETYTSDEIGVISPTIEWRKVFAKVASVSATEFFSGSQTGFRPDLRFRIFSRDYSGERLVDFDGAVYTVYRTYRDGDLTELYTERRIGDGSDS